MTTNAQRDSAIAAALAAGAKPHECNPLLYPLYWKLGINIPPPIFAPVWLTAPLYGMTSALVWGIFMWLSTWSQDPGMGWEKALGRAAIFGAFTAIATGCHLFYRKRKLKLPAWTTFGPN